MKKTSFGKKIAGIIAAAIMTMSVMAVSASAESENLGRGDTVAEINTIARVVDAQEWELINPNSITDANATAGGGMKLMITFTEALSEGYEVEINFTTESGITKKFTAQSQVIPMQTNYSCISIRDIFDKLGLGGQKLTSVTFTGRSAGSIMKIEYMTGRVTDPVTVTASDSASASASEKDVNPATGVEDLTFPLVIAGFCGVVAILTMKDRRFR